MRERLGEFTEKRGFMKWGGGFILREGVESHSEREEGDDRVRDVFGEMEDWRIGDLEEWGCLWGDGRLGCTRGWRTASI